MSEPYKYPKPELSGRIPEQRLTLRTNACTIKLQRQGVGAHLSQTAVVSPTGGVSGVKGDAGEVWWLRDAERGSGAEPTSGPEGQ